MPDSDQPIPFRRFAEPALIASVFGLAYLILEPSSADHAAQVFRSGLFESEGLSAWNNFWFGGHHTPGYSVLFPLLGSVLGPREAGVLATIVAAILFGAIAYRQWGDRARLGVIWFAAGASVNLFTGRLSFALGIALALAAVYAAQRGWRPLAIAFAILTPLASPVAALFLGCAAIAHSIAERKRQGLELAAAAVGSAVLLAVAFPEGGTHPFEASSFQPALLIAIAVFLAIPKEEKILRYGVAAYAAALACSFLIESPMGGNVTRMGILFLGPVLALSLWRRQRFALLLLAPFLVYWQWSPVVRDLETVHAQPSVEAEYYAPVVDYLRGVPGNRSQRIEVLPVEHHWESALMSRSLYLARGWERQLDRKLNSLFYEEEAGPLRPAVYRSWLDDLAVGHIAVPDTKLDYAGDAEARLIERGLPFLSEVFTSADWTVYRVEDPEPLANGIAKSVKLTAEGFVLVAREAGSAVVKVRWTPYWQIEQGTGCLEESFDGFTRVRTEEPGVIRIGVDVSPWRALDRGARCADKPPAVDGWEKAVTF